jgi:CRISPR-associated protein Cas5t
MAIKAIKLEIYQNMPNYRMPSSLNVQQSYPLPPYSTVIGMIHNACKFTSYHDMKISIQGESKSNISNLFTRYYFGMKYEKERHQLKTSNGMGITRGLGYSELLIDVNLIIHVLPNNDEDFDLILNGLKKPAQYLSLGRYEDIIRIDNVSVIELEYKEEVRIKRNTYVPLEILNQTENDNYLGTNYFLNKKYSLAVKEGYRKWDEKIKVKVINDAVLYLIDAKNCFVEKETKNGVFFA